MIYDREGWVAKRKMHWRCWDMRLFLMAVRADGRRDGAGTGVLARPDLCARPPDMLPAETGLFLCGPGTARPTGPDQRRAGPARPGRPF